MYKDFRHYSQTFTHATQASCGPAPLSAAVPVPLLLRLGQVPKKKGATSQLYVEGLNGETARHNDVSALAAEAS